MFLSESAEPYNRKRLNFSSTSTSTLRQRQRLQHQLKMWQHQKTPFGSISIFFTIVDCWVGGKEIWNVCQSVIMPRTLCEKSWSWNFDCFTQSPSPSLSLTPLTHSLSLSSTQALTYWDLLKIFYPHTHTRTHTHTHARTHTHTLAHTCTNTSETLKLTNALSLTLTLTLSHFFSQCQIIICLIIARDINFHRVL